MNHVFWKSAATTPIDKVIAEYRNAPDEAAVAHAERDAQIAELEASINRTTAGWEARVKQMGARA